MENDQLVEFRIRKNNPPERRQTAWEFMGQEVPETYLNLLDNLFEERRRVEVPSGSASAEVVGTEAATVEASSSSAPAEVFDVDAEISALNTAETQAVQIISENPWHLYHAGVLTLRDNKGERVTNPYGEPVLIIREFFMMSTSQQESVRAQGIIRHIWERFPLAGHSVLFFTRSWEIGRMTAYVKNYSADQEKETHQMKLQYYENVGWRREVPEPYKAPAGGR